MFVCVGNHCDTCTTFDQNSIHATMECVFGACDSDDGDITMRLRIYIRKINRQEGEERTKTKIV